MLRFHLALAVRSLIRRPGFALAAILLLALGTGANAAVFSVVRGVLLRPLPYAQPERLVSIWPGEYISNQEIGHWRDAAPSLDQVASLAPGWLMALVAEGGEPLDVTGARVSDNLFETLGVRAALGRTIVTGESTPGREGVVVLSDDLWRRRFAADPATIGRSDPDRRHASRSRGRDGARLRESLAQATSCGRPSRSVQEPDSTTPRSQWRWDD